MNVLLINIAFAILWCARLRKNQKLISNHYSRQLTCPKCPFHIGWAGCSLPFAWCNNVHLVYYDFFFFFHINFWRTSSRHHFSHFCHSSACGSDRIYCSSHSLPGFIFHLFVSVSGRALLSRGETSVTFPAAFKGRVVTISNQLVHIFMLMKAVREHDSY